MSLPSLHRIALWVLLLLAGPAAVAQRGGGGRGDRGDRRGRREAPPTTPADLERLRDELLTDDPISADKFANFIMAVSDESTRRGLPSFRRDPEALYSDEQVEFRREMYGELMADPEAHAFLVESVRDVEAANFSVGFTAPILFGDMPSGEHLAALYEGYRNSSSRSFFTTTLVRQLGRALEVLRDDEDSDTRSYARDILRELELHAGGDDGRLAGQALQIFQRAGETDRARVHLQRFLAADGEPVQRLETLSACAELLKDADFAPEMRARTLELARGIARRSLEESDPAAGLASLSPEARAFQAAVNFLSNVAVIDRPDLVLEICEDPRAPALLGMDGVQSLRFALQRARRDMDEESVALLDDFYLRPLRETGERLFLLEEEPMDRGEFQTFFEQRDLRYNAASYVQSQWERSEELRDRFLDDPDLVIYLGCLVNADEVDRDEDDLYHAVSEKTETRLVCAQLLASIRAEDASAVGEEVDLFTTFLEVLIEEVGAPRRLLEVAAEAREIGGAHLTLEVPVKKTPEDRWLMNQAVDGLRALGHAPTREGDVYRIALAARDTVAGE